MTKNEIIVVEIPTPAMLREVVEANRELAKQREAERIAKQEREDREAIVEVVEYIKKKMMESTNFFFWDSTIYPADMKAPMSSIERACPVVEEIFKQAGYDVRFHEYSTGWYNRSGKFGYFAFHFDK